MTEAVQLGRYTLFAKLAAGGMAAVYLGRLNGEVGFGRTVAIKRLHPHLAGESEFLDMFLDEARLAARIQHPNVIPTLDVASTGGELFIVMEYVRGEALSRLLRTSAERQQRVPVPIAATVTIEMLRGLHAAHEARDEEQRPLQIVHRDVSPQNVLVGADGVSRVLDFGVAKAARRLQTTRQGQTKGKLSYMSPEQVRSLDVTRSTDVYAAGIVFWEALACRRLFDGDNDAAVIRQILSGATASPSSFNRDVPPELDRIVMRALARNPADRYVTAANMAEAIDAALRPASHPAVGQWVTELATGSLVERDDLVSAIERGAPGPQSLRRNFDQHRARESSASRPSLPSLVKEPELLGSTVHDGPPATLASPHSTGAQEMGVELLGSTIQDMPRGTDPAKARLAPQKSAGQTAPLRAVVVPPQPPDVTSPSLATGYQSSPDASHVITEASGGRTLAVVGFALCALASVGFASWLFSRGHAPANHDRESATGTAAPAAAPVDASSSTMPLADAASKGSPSTTVAPVASTPSKSETRAVPSDTNGDPAPESTHRRLAAPPATRGRNVPPAPSTNSDGLRSLINSRL
jgi:eukaryotic-like serine/threonine-protein kinase